MKLKEHLLPQDYEAKDEMQLEEEMESKAFTTTKSLLDIKSLEEIEKFLRDQADLRALENDDAGVLQEMADRLREWIDHGDEE